MEQHLEISFSGQQKASPASTVFQEVENAYRASTDISLFSSSLPVILHEKYGFPLEDESEDIATSLTGSMLPGEEDEPFTGTDDFDLGDLPTQLEDLDLEDDLFESGGGMEMDSDSRDGIRFGLSNLRLSDSVPLTGIINRHELPNGVAPVVGEHPYGEHPSRTLFVRNINSNVEDSELRCLFEEYGEIRNLYTACKHRGFVMISYYDIRHARAAMRELQNKPLRRRKLDIHFSIPKDNPSEKDINQGTLVVFNLDASVSSDDLRHIFSVYGEVKEIRETPHKRHHKFVEFYDVRAADMALKDLNGREIAGKRIKLEHSRPGGARRNLMQQLSLALEQDETRPFWHHVGSPVINSPPGSWTHLSSPRDHGSPQGFSWSSGLGTLSPGHNPLPGLASILPPHISNPVKIAPIGKDNVFKSTLGFDHQQSHSSPGNTVNTPSLNNSNFDPSSLGRLSGPEFLWGSPTTYSDHQSSSSWRASSVYASPSQHGSFLGQLHHVGSAPSAERTIFNGVGPVISNGSGSPISRMTFFPNKGPMIMGSGSYQGRGALNEGLNLTERSHSRRVDYAVNQMGNKQYQLDLQKIISGEDSRTTLMIKNIPNKYTSKMLLAAIDENHKGTYDFVYLPIDFKNKCNVGYAFINMVSPSHIISFYEVFNGKKWEKFNSEKVASLAYARIQGKVALITHFQNSSLMNEDKWCRPIIFQSEAQENDNLDSIPYHNMNICIRQPDGSYSVDSLDGSTSSPEKN
ncbi:putative RNA recognition motif domain, mei2/Mei2-like RNA recognition [Helianthus annuus]|nr:putative RNA recognition motif domain, mei2-like RNA recognition, RNA-binding domain superfamily [Helianthus annuus]KAJ0479857.1 putative RNA recognition motif domain, mei2/Mei2-like RNA recognition [Helianthus annuus]KAJ0662689.1 putative RNA recognition motif domain, mei2-like RNA recognition, RNA-binding domain superfamily [Helianthus annuus]KAJ0670195.1 putative RNA recognition motif domain, mei2-like RNA recognition, RNA-binding domain superfamily [Helianthus annuus]KAJ0848056.1 putativ